MSSKDYKIAVGDLYRKFEGLGSSNNTYALITGSGETIVEYQIISDSALYGELFVDKAKMMSKDFLKHYKKVLDDGQHS